ncbi:MAG: multicopper oxidase domain-containing protein, partial [Asticcacaulis sp.]
LAYNERVRLIYVNETMMAHPLHLHGMFVQLENGQDADRLPNKHTVIVPPGQTVSVLLSANEPGDWPYHCHLMFHMQSGMMTTLRVAAPDKTVTPPVEAPQPDQSQHGEDHHAHH